MSVKFSSASHIAIEAAKGPIALLVEVNRLELSGVIRVVMGPLTWVPHHCSAPDSSLLACDKANCLRFCLSLSPIRDLQIFFTTLLRRHKIADVFSSNNLPCFDSIAISFLDRPKIGYEIKVC